MSTCKSCGKPIVWMTTPRGIPIPVDDEPEQPVVTILGALVRGRTPHWLTCPTPNENLERLDQLSLKGVT